MTTDAVYQCLSAMRVKRPAALFDTN